MKKAGKIWGETVQIVANSSLELHRIEIHPDTQCSKHCHEYKWNGFYVEKGRVMIRVWKSDYDLVDETVLEAGDYTEVKPGDFHQFVAVSSEMSVVFEVYFANFQHDDIKRESVGGVVGADRVVMDAPVQSRHKDPTLT
jgi:mannose-6-phosphate isomerase-like protein (cupin superfamily)